MIDKKPIQNSKMETARLGWGGGMWRQEGSRFELRVEKTNEKKREAVL